MDIAGIQPIPVPANRLPLRLRFEAWREAFALKVARVEAATPHEAGFHAEARFQPLPGLSLSRNAVSPLRLARTRQPLRDGDDGVAFVICLEGRGDAVFGDESVPLNAGQAMLVPRGGQGGIVAHTDVVTLTIRLERNVAAEIVPALDDTILHRLPAGDPAVGLLASYCEQLLSSDGIPAPLASLASAQIRELMTHLLDPASGLARAAPFGGVKAARLRSVLNAITRRFREPSLSAARIGLGLGLTERYVQQLMEGIGLSFTAHVRNLRLDEARRMLRDRRFDHMRISDIAYAVGFQDLSYFNREFRRRVGEKPSASRRGA
jgi:AraC-like DNA-binding protein